MFDRIVKDPDATLDYQRDWSTWLADGETITESTWIVPAGLTVTSETLVGGDATVWLSGGTAGEDYTVVNRITTSDGRTDDRSIVIHVRER